MPICTPLAIHLMELPATFGSAQSLGSRHILCYSSNMSATSKSCTISTAPHKDPRGRRRPIGWHRAAVLEPKFLQLHAQLLAEGKPMSGRCGGYVYSWHHGRLHWHRYVVPKDPCTLAQRRSRAAFGTASKAWSENNTLTPEQRDAWHAEAAKIKSRPRLGQSGRLTAQQHIVGRNSLKERWGLQLLLEPPKGGRMNAECRMKNTEAAPEVSQPQRLNSTSSDRPHTAPRLPPDRHRAGKGHTGRPSALRVPTQVAHYKSLTRPSSDRFRATSVSLPVHYRWLACSRSRGSSIGCPRWSSTLAHIRRNAHSRELWRGG
jgi:hypothetical protein